MSITYSNIHALRDAFNDAPNDFPLGCVHKVKTPGAKRKTDNYRLESMTEMNSSIASLHWVYQAPPPKSRDGIDWAAYRAGRGR